jgi:hypothetical protein
METLLRYLNARTFLILGGLVAFVVLADRFQEYPRGRYENWLNSRERGRSALGAAIAQDLDARESAKLKALHRTVSEEIAAARAKGFDVARLQPIADKALMLDTPQYRPAALERLNQLRLVIPHSVEPFRPAADDDEPSDIPADPKSSAARPVRSR